MSQLNSVSQMNHDATSDVHYRHSGINLSYPLTSKNALSPTNFQKHPRTYHGEKNATVIFRQARST